jgi:hypothetical protein
MKSPQLYQALDQAQIFRGNRSAQTVWSAIHQYSANTGLIQTHVPANASQDIDQYSAAIIMGYNQGIAELLLGATDAREFRRMLDSAAATYNDWIHPQSIDGVRKLVANTVYNWQERGL